MKRWTEGEIAVLIAEGRHVPDSKIARKLGRTLDAVKCKKSELGILKVDPTRYQRIPTEPEEARPPRFTEMPTPPETNGDRAGRSQILMMFLSRLDEFDMETLNRIEEAVNIAKKGLRLLHRE